MKEDGTMYRKLIHEIEAWEKASTPEPLMVIGARQVGKTWLLKEFCQSQYSDWLYINLEEQSSIQSVFDGDLSPGTILRNLSILIGRKITENTALFLDEIQVCERAITSLKYFCEAKENYRVITAGSLLGVKMNRFSSSFPVGKVHICHLYPLDFEEFLLGCGEDLLRDSIQEAFVKIHPLPNAIHEKALQLCYDYMIVGGMPQAVLGYLDKNKDISSFPRDIHRNLIMTYLADMTKYVRSPYETEKISQVYQSVPRQLAKENPKFKYNLVRSTANRRDFDAPIDWLKTAGMVLQIMALEAPLTPLKGYVKESSFKLYLSDVGLLSALSDVRPRDLIPEQDNLYKGPIAENYIAQQLIVQRDSLYYFKPSESLEIDLIEDDGTHIVPVEIKAGRHKKSRSLQNYIEKYHPEYAIRISALNFGKADRLFSIPLYSVFCLASGHIPLTNECT